MNSSWLFLWILGAVVFGVLGFGVLNGTIALAMKWLFGISVILAIVWLVGGYSTGHHGHPTPT